MTADQHALALATEERQRTIMPLRKKAASLSSSSTAARAGIEETTQTLRELKTRLRLLENQERATAADIAAAEREYATFTSRVGGQKGSQRPPSDHPAAQQPPATANLATFVAPAAQKPPATANLATFVAPAAQQLLAPTTSAVFTVQTTTQRRQTPTPATVKPSAPTAPTPLGPPCRPQPPPHRGRSLPHATAVNPCPNHPSPPTMTPT